MLRGIWEPDRPSPRGIAFIAAVLVACSSTEIEFFEVQPRRVCEGDTVAVRWGATDEVRLTSEPGLPVAGTIAATDTLRVPIAERTLFRLAALDGKSYAEQEVLVYAGGQRDTVSGSTSAVGDSALIASVEVPPDKWADVLRIGTVASLSGREITVRHAGQEAVLPADTTPLPALEGLKMTGQWEFRAPLVQGEVMGDPSRPPPENLWILVELKCQRQG